MKDNKIDLNDSELENVNGGNFLNFAKELFSDKLVLTKNNNLDTTKAYGQDFETGNGKYFKTPKKPS